MFLNPRSRRRLFSSALAALLTAAFLPAAAGAAARPDPGFGGGDGWVTTSFGNDFALAYAVAVLDNGKIVTAGQVSGQSGNGQVVVARYRRDGTPDPAFGDGGVFVSSFPDHDGPFIATAVAQEPGTKRLIVGGGYGQGSMLALRLTHGGRLDRGFGSGGSGFTALPVGGIAQSMAIDGSGRILLGGSNADAAGRPMVVARLDPGGGVDDGFAGDGIAQSRFWNAQLASSAGVVGIEPNPGGGLVAAGHLDYIGSDGHGSAGVFRLRADGKPAGRYGTDGHVEIDFSGAAGRPAFWFPCATTMDDRGRFTVTGDGTTAKGAGILTARLTRSGDPDPGFGRTGDGTVVTTGPSDGNGTTCGAALTPVGGLTVGVESAVVQISARGARRASFGPRGKVDVEEPAGVSLNALEQDGPRRIVVAGSAGNDVYVSRWIVPGSG